MNWFVRWLRRKLREEDILQTPQIAHDSDSPPDMRFAIRNAINGKLIELATRVNHPRGYEWTTEYYLVPEDKKVSEALTMLILLKGADK